MRNSYTPFFNMPDCYSQYRQDNKNQTMPITIYPNLNPKFNNGSGTAYNQSMSQSQSQVQGQMQQGQVQGQMQQGQISPSDSLAPITPTTEPQALSVQSTEFLNGYLRTQIGKRVKVEFLIGTGTLVDKFGTLLSVGANFISLRQAETDDIIVCDFFTIKFITFYY